MTFCIQHNVIIDEFRFKISQLLQIIDLTVADADNNSEDNKKNEYSDKVKDIKIYFLHHNDTLEDLCYVEKKLIGIAPKASLQKYYSQITSRYREILPQEAEKYIFKGDISQSADEFLRDETFYISVLLHKYYHFLDNKEKIIANYKRLFVFLLLAMFLISGVCFVFFIMTQSARPGSKIVPASNVVMLVIAMICAGYFGAVISIVKRIHQISEKSLDGIDREELLLKLANGKWGIFLSIVLGTLAPFVLLLLLLNLQEAKITIGSFNVLPQFCSALHICGNATNQSENSVMNLLYELTFATKKDLAEFILLSVACGFTERFIPDVLDRVSKELDKNIQDQPKPTAKTGTEDNKDNTKK